jgi:hypothetical protein
LDTEGEDSGGVLRDEVVKSSAEADGAETETAGDETTGDEAAGAFAITTRVKGNWMMGEVVTGMSGVGEAGIKEDEEDGSTGLP